MADSYSAPVAEPTGAATNRPTTTKGPNVSSSYDVLLYFVAIFVPPVPVLLKRGLGVEFCINILLWILGWFPGVIHSWYIISKSQGVM